MNQINKTKKNNFPAKYLFALMLQYKTVLVAFVLTLILVSFFDSFGLAMLFPLFEIIIGNETGNKLSEMLTLPLRALGIEVNIINLSIMILVIVFSKFFLKLLNAYFTHRLIFDIRAFLMKNINDFYLSSPYSDTIKKKQGTLLNNLIDVPHKATAGMMKLSEFVISLFMILFYYGLLFLTNFKITIILTLLSVIVYLIFSKLSKIYIQNLGQKQLVFNQDISSIGAESISAIRQVKTLNLKDKIQKNLTDKLDKLINVDIKYAVFQVLPHSVIELILFIGVISSIIIIYKISPNLMTSIIPTFTLFVVVSQRLVGDLNRFIAARTSLSYYIPSISLTEEILNKNKKLKNSFNNKNIIEFNSLDTDIVFENVDFGYDKSQLLFKKLNFKIPRRKVTAIIGESGSGKSTIIDLILGLYSPVNGRLSINGKNLSCYSKDQWREKIGFVSQDNFLFHSTIKDNIRLGNPRCSESEIIAASKKANAHKFISDLSNGYNTVVGDRGLLLSGGQKQRIAIARAIVKDPEIFIFDEATSALDYRTEKDLQGKINKLSKNKTVIVISHRKETLRNADLIIEIKKQKIIINENKK